MEDIFSTFWAAPNFLPEEARGEPEMPWGPYGRSLTLGFVASLSKLWMDVMNTTTVHNQEGLLKAAQERPRGQALLTVSNHTSTLDDPLLFAAALPLRFFFTEHEHHNNRWTLGAREMTHTNRLTSNFFMSGKVLPIDRGSGVNQPTMRVATELIARGDWLHVFPEARVVFDGRLGPLRWGVGHLLCNAVALQPRSTPLPLVLPFFHSGMGRVMPRNSKVPRIANDVTIRVGQPIEMDDILCQCRTERDEGKRKDLYIAITRKIERALLDLERQSPSLNPCQLSAKERLAKGLPMEDPREGRDERPIVTEAGSELENRTTPSGPSPAGRGDSAGSGGEDSAEMAGVGDGADVPAAGHPQARSGGVVSGNNAEGDALVASR